MKYRYNPQGDRIELAQRGQITRYVIDDAHELSRVLMELDGEGHVKSRYIYGLGLIGREDADGTYLSYHYDLRGSTTLLTDEQNRLTDRYTYGLYGELEQHEGVTSQSFAYNGRDGVMTDANGLYYMRARYYDPKLKRFLNRDVIRGEIQDGQTFNRYAYVNGNPVSYIDPLGLMKCETEGTGNTSVPEKPGGGSDRTDFVNDHSYKRHQFKSDVTSTKNKSQYGENVDVGKLRHDTVENPDKAYSNWPNPNNPNPSRITKYMKEYDKNISTPDTPTGSHRVFENLDDPSSSSHFPYVPRK
ncbi:RHS repeat-associated core domain-containing protein [Paenibacillus xylanexedens]|uniref:RHS repeat-associated core domain-containing protein n=1 Tax=Paenibacillus xylanexedens TaxID=528191 RepID=UPI003D07E1FD